MKCHLRACTVSGIRDVGLVKAVFDVHKGHKELEISKKSDRRLISQKTAYKAVLQGSRRPGMPSVYDGTTECVSTAAPAVK